MFFAMKQKFAFAGNNPADNSHCIRIHQMSIRQSENCTSAIGVCVKGETRYKNCFHNLANVNCKITTRRQYMQ